MSIPASSTQNSSPGTNSPSTVPTALGPRPKRRRLNHACNYCRSRKVKCDEQDPCHACAVAGLKCITVDRRRPGVHVARHEAGSGAKVRPPQSAASTAASSEGQDPSLTISPAWNEASPPLVRDIRPSWSAAGPDRVDGHHGSTPDDPHTEVDPVKRITKFSGRLPMLEPSSGASTPELLTDWLDLAFHRLGVRRRLGPVIAGCPSIFQQPVLSLDAPVLPDLTTARSFLKQYLEHANAVFPLLDAGNISQMVSFICEHGPDPVSQDYGFLATIIVYLVLAIGAPCQYQEISLALVDFCRPYIGHIIGVNSLQAVQAMFLLAFALKLHDQVIPAKSTLDLCVSIATSMGLNRIVGSTEATRVSGTLVGKELEAQRTWWCIYCFERLFSFELGHPSQVIRGEIPELDVSTWNYSPSGQTHPMPEFIRIVAQLAEVFGEIGRRSAQANVYESTADSKSMEEAIKMKLDTTGEMIMLLKNWAEGLPEEYRPGSDCIYKEDTFPSASFISLQYYHALLLLTRNSLLVSDKALRMAVETVAKGKPWEHTIRSGRLMAANTARKIVQLLIAENDYGHSMLLPSMTAPLHAIYLLYVNIIKQPTSMIVKSDLNLIQAGADFAKQQCETFSANGKKLEQALETLAAVITTVISESTNSVSQMSPQADNIPQDHQAANNTEASEATAKTPRPPTQQSSGAHPERMGQEYFGAHGEMSLENSAHVGQSVMGNVGLSLTAFTDHSAGGVFVPFNPYMSWDWADFAQIFPEDGNGQ